LAAEVRRRRGQEWIKFLKQIDDQTPADLDLYLIADNDAMHKHPKVLAWLKRHPRFHMHFTPTSSSWLNWVERWFREITDQRIRRGVCRSVQQLIDAITAWIQEHNQPPHAFVWTASVEKILEKVRRAREVLDEVPSAQAKCVCPGLLAIRKSWPAHRGGDGGAGRGARLRVAGRRPWAVSSSSWDLRRRMWW